MLRAREYCYAAAVDYIHHAGCDNRSKFHFVVVSNKNLVFMEHGVQSIVCAFVMIPDTYFTTFDGPYHILELTKSSSPFVLPSSTSSPIILMTDHDASTTTSGDATRFEAFEYQVQQCCCVRKVLCLGLVRGHM